MADIVCKMQLFCLSKFQNLFVNPLRCFPYSIGQEMCWLYLKLIAAATYNFCTIHALDTDENTSLSLSHGALACVTEMQYGVEEASFQQPLRADVGMPLSFRSENCRKFSPANRRHHN